MEPFGGSGFHTVGIVTKKRSATSRIPRKSLEGLSVSPLSSTHSSENAGKQSPDSEGCTDFHRKHLDLNSPFLKISSINGIEGIGSSKKNRKDSQSYGEYDGILNADELRRNNSDLKKCSRVKEKVELRIKSPTEYVRNGNNGSHSLGHQGGNSNGSAENKFKKVRLKVGGVTHTIHAKSTPESGNEKYADATRLDQKLFEKQAENAFGGASTSESVRKSKRVPKKRQLDEGDDDDAEIRYLEKLRSSKIGSEYKAKHENDQGGCLKKQKTSKGFKNSAYDEDVDYGLSQPSEDCGNKSRSDRSSEDMECVEDDAGSDAGPEVKKRKQSAGDVFADDKKEIPLTTRQRALQSSKDGTGGNSASLVEFPNGLPPAPPRRQKEKLSEVEQQLKKAEAAQRRRLQMEKAAKENEAEAIRKILGQDSSRKKREDKLRKKRDEIAQEKAANSMTLASNTIRWVMGPTGTTVIFPESIGIPSILNSKPCSYPPPREKCAGPACTNAYKYRDSKSNLPLCSLQCYKAVQQVTSC